MPVVLKDNVCTRGVRTTASSKILDNYVPVYNAHIVDKLKAAGAVVIAKASMDELAMGGTNLTAATGRCIIHMTEPAWRAAPPAAAQR